MWTVGKFRKDRGQVKTHHCSDEYHPYATTCVSGSSHSFKKAVLFERVSSLPYAAILIFIPYGQFLVREKNQNIKGKLDIMSFDCGSKSQSPSIASICHFLCRRPGKGFSTSMVLNLIGVHYYTGKNLNHCGVLVTVQNLISALSGGCLSPKCSHHINQGGWRMACSQPQLTLW